MRTPYTLRDSSVLYEGREELKRVEVNDAVIHALQRRLRLNRYDKNFFRSLDAYGEASLTWNVTRRISHRDNHWATLEAWRLDDGTHHLYLVGPQAETVIDKINDALFDKRPKWLKKKIWAQEHKRTTRRRRKPRKSGKALHGGTPKGRGKGSKALPSHALTLQFRHNPISFSEAIDLCVFAGQVKREARRSAREIVASELYRALEHTEDGFAQFRRGAFRLNFRFVRAITNEDRTLPAVRVWCTKDSSKEYRRTRTWLHRHLDGLSDEERSGRRTKLGLRLAA